MKLDTKKEGLDALWRLYEVASIEFLLDNGRSTSGQVWDAVAREVAISRASVIYFLNRLVEEGLAQYETGTGKGGHHKIYYLIADTWEELNDTVIDRFLYKLWEIFPSSEKMAQVIKA